MGVPHVVKIGMMGAVGKFESLDYQHYPRGSRVICRTSRGLECGRVLCSLDNETTALGTPDGQLLRLVGSEDELILERSGTTS